ncbi:MAG: DNA-binding response regulator [Betaproteobacteria bacterium]|nr:DNA-binding response regulator [Betaproteobacteria bacterium]HAB48262.1 DNA-binding response regulator [Lautropia sp.]NBO96501.1 DNA-binding response regulator [Betaproteobacteria bacterium]NBP35905.1 DNA-binding response regulator [Betaproteobacteria bacterium]NBQ78907.1 DNA-binding response regulator [Betaproteobacteria bacterium]
MTNTSATPARLVCIVDDDPAVRDSLALMLGLKGFDCRVFDSAEHFLKMPPSRACCLILDLRMNGMSGLELQERLSSLQVRYEVVFLSAFADTHVMRQAFLNQAADFLEKPVVIKHLLEALERSFSRLDQTNQSQAQEQMHEALTPREREVLDAVAKGLNHREIGEALGISPRTVEVHKSRIMAKFDVKSLAELLRLVLRGDRPKQQRSG